MRTNQFNTSKQSNFTEITLRHGCSLGNLLHIFRTPFPKNTSGGLPLKGYISSIAVPLAQNLKS